MFNRVTNIDLLNKIVELENKIDIVNLKLSKDDNTTLQGCCDCKAKELIIYKEIKEYFESKFEDILNKIEHEEPILENYKNEILTSFENIISKLETKRVNDVNDNFIQKIKDIYKIVTEINSHKILKDEIKENFETIHNKINLLYYENETIKHQFLLEEDIRKYQEDIRKYQEEINNVSKIVNETIEYIDNLIINNGKN